MAKPKMGANVMYCGHNGYFIADIFTVGNVNVIVASREVDPGNIFRNEEFGPGTHHLSDFPSAGVWKPHKGIFVVPQEQVKEL